MAGAISRLIFCKMVIKRQEATGCKSLASYAGFVLLIIAAAALLVPEAGIQPLSTALGDFRDAMHYPLFIAITILMLVLLRGAEESRDRRSWWIAAGLAVFAGVSEILQGLSDRSPSWSDFFLNLTGILIGFCLVIYWRRRSAMAVTVVLVAAFGIALVAAWNPLSVWRAKLAQRDAMPVLFDASQPLAMSLIGAKEGTTVRRDDGLLWVECTPGPWRGVNLSISPGEGWGEWDALEIRFRNNAHALEGGIRLDGGDNRRASAFFHCPKGDSTVRVARSELDGDRDAVWQAPSDVLIHLGAEGGVAGFAIEEIRLANPTK